MAKEADSSATRSNYGRLLLGKARGLVQKLDREIAHVALSASKSSIAELHDETVTVREQAQGPATPVVDVAAACRASLNTLFESDAGIGTVGICTEEGLEIDRITRDTNASLPRMFEVASALAKLCNEVSGEFKIGEFNNIVVDASPGRALIVHIKTSGRNLILVVIAAETTLLGILLTFVKECTVTIKNILGTIDRQGH